MGKEVVRKLLSNVPEEHRITDDARLEWMWNQRLATVQNIFTNTTNVRDRMAATLVLGAAFSANLASIELLLRRLESGAMSDEAIVEADSLVI